MSARKLSNLGFRSADEPDPELPVPKSEDFHVVKQL